MTDFGGRLREAREQRGISLRQIAANTKISVAALQALERNDVSKLPGGIFSRSFVRSYASEVGLDPDQTVTEFLERFQGEQAAAPAARVVTEAENFQFSERRAAGMAVQAIVILAVLGGVFAMFAFRGKEQTPAGSIAADSSAPRAEVATSPPPSTAQAAVPAVDDVLRATGPMKLELHPTGPCWVKVSADGQDLFAKLMQAGQRETFTVRKAAVLSIGDAGAFAFSVDGHPGRSLGTSGQVTTARITRDTLADFLR